MIGLGLPNRRLEPGELDRILALGCLAYVIYTTVEEAGYWAGVAAEIKRREPRARVDVRVERRGALDTGGDAEIVVRVAAAFGALADTIRIRNEANRESPGETPSTWAAHLVALARALPADVRAKLAAPAVSPSGDWLPWLEATIAAARAAGIPVLDAHAYGSPSEVGQVLAEHRRRWEGRLLVGETNFGAGRRYSLQRWADELPEVLAVCRERRAEAVCVFIWHWSTPDVALPTPVDVRGSPMERAIREAAKAGGGVAMAEFDSPNHDGPRAETLGVVVHSTRGGAPSLAAEFQATRDWHRKSRGKRAVSSHAIIGPEGEVDRPVDLDLVAWHAREYNQTHLGIELAQAREGQMIPPACLAAAAKVVAEWCVRYGIPLEWDLRRGLAEHYEIPPGRRDRKSDVGPPFDRSTFLAAVRAEVARLTPQPAVDPVTDALNGIWAYLAQAEAASDLGAARLAVQQARVRVVRLKRALGLE